jgi:hypothetical protein
MTMSDHAQTEQRLAAIAAKQGQAALLLSEVRQEPLKQQVLLALRDLDEGRQWLRKENADAPPFSLELLDATVRLATARLNMVKKALQAHGPEATLAD